MKRKTLIMMGMVMLSFAMFAHEKNNEIDSLGVSPVAQLIDASSVSPATLGSTIPDIVPPSPHAAELGRFGAVPVGLYTGTIQYSIPLYELKSQHLSLPISLNYSSNGFKVDKVASWVGYDWSLNAGGVITRYRHGKTDVPGTRPYSDFSSLSTSEKLGFLDMLVSAQNDLQPDIFVISLPNFTCKFAFNNLGEPVTIPYTPIKIETNSTGSYSYFHITTPDGILYKFEDAEYTAPPSESSFATAWHLSEIVHPTGENITFTYTSHGIAQKVGIDRKVMLNVEYYGGDPAGSCNNSEFKEQITSMNNTIRYLSQINFPGVGKVVFGKSSGRSDAMNEYKLDNITIEDHTNTSTVVKEIKLNYSFPLKSGNFPCQISTTTDVNYHMFLTSVDEKNASSSTVRTHSFEYNEMSNLPARFSYAQDHWGYFNGKSNNDIISLDDVPSNYQGLFSGHVGSTVDRTPNYLYARKGMLSKIVYPTGGYSTFDYEANKNSSGIQIGGCRILRTKTYPSASSSPSIKKYNYTQVATSGTLYPTYYQSQSTYYDYVWNSAYFSGQCIYGTLTSNSLLNLYVDGQNQVCYPGVEVLSGENGENGKEKYSFRVVYDSPGTPINGGQIYPLPVSNDGWSSGTQEVLLTSDNSASKKKEEFNYNYSETRNKEEVSCLVTNRRLSPVYAPWNDYEKLSYYDVVPYKLYSNWYYVASSVVTHYESDGTIVVTTGNTYNNEDHCQVTLQSVTNSNGVQQNTQFYYPQDYSTGGYNFSTLIDKNIISKPVDVRLYRGGQLSNGVQRKYNVDGLVTDVYCAEPTGTDITFSNSSPYTFTHKAAYLYNTNDVVKQVTDDASYNTAFLWDETGNYLKAKIENATYSQVSSQDGKTYSYSSKTLYNSLNSLVPGAMITTYSHQPLIGITEQTDPKGLTAFYEYDDFGRLKNIRNDDDYITSRNFYHYYNEATGDEGDEGEAPQPYFSVSTSSLIFGPSGGTQSFNVQTNIDWTVIDCPTWVMLSKTSGTGDATINVTCGATGYQRGGAVVLESSYGLTVYLTVGVGIIQNYY